MCTNLTYFQRKELIQLERSPSKKDTFYSVHVWGPSVHILQGWIQSMINYLNRNVFIVGDMVFNSIDTPNADRNMVQIAILKLSRRIQFSPETVENVQWGWNRNFIRCLRKIADGSRGKLIWRVSSYDNRVVSFSKFYPYFFRPSSLFLPNMHQPNLLSKERNESVTEESS